MPASICLRSSQQSCTPQNSRLGVQNCKLVGILVHQQRQLSDSSSQTSQRAGVLQCMRAASLSPDLCSVVLRTALDQALHAV